MAKTGKKRRTRSATPTEVKQATNSRGGKSSNRAPDAMLLRVRQVAEERGGECLSKRYVSSPSKLRFECAAGHRWRAIGSNIVHLGQWCPRCATTPTEEYRQRLATFVLEKGGEMLSRKLGALSDLHRFKCRNGHVFKQRPTRVVHKGTWCPECAYLESADKQRVGIEVVREIAKSKGGECLSKEYKTANDHGLFKCAVGHEWQARYKTVLYRDTWCPECWNELKRAGLNKDGKFVLRSMPRQLGLEYCQEYAEEYGGKCISIEYENYQSTLEWVCKKGHEFETSLHSMEQRESFCLECAELERRERWLRKAEELAREHGGRCLSTEWVSAQKKLQWRCAKGHEFERCWNQAIRPPFCCECDRDERYQKQGEELLTSIAEMQNGRWVKERYKGVRVSYRWVCSEGVEFEATPNVARRTWHKNCECK